MTEKPKYQVNAEFLNKMEELRTVVQELSELYSEHEWLNDEFNIQKLVPMSLDEWEGEIAGFLADPHGYE